MDAQLEFPLRLHRALTSEAGRNFCWSPYSVVSTLGMLASAARGNTRAEMARMLGAEPDGRFPEQLRAVAEQTVVAGEDVDAAVANRLWVDEELVPRAEYRAEFSDWPGSRIRTTPFRAAPERARQEINADVAEVTRELIPELVKAGTVDSETVAALVNALYLRTPWNSAFEQRDTTPLPFHAPGGTRSVPTMRVNAALGYARAEGWQVVRLPARGGVEALVLLPDSALETAEPELTPTRLRRLVTAPQQRQVELRMPKFEVTGSAELNDPLTALGMRTAFTPAADFGGLTEKPLRISTAVHEAVLRVDENGLEGAAATAAMMRLTALVEEPEPLRVTVDRPFWFLVRHSGGGAVYFLARVVSPEGEAG
ncbi:serpin family protein [Actinopolyspora mortivallis]|uniref:Serpin family protein n=1 Tax=Actinopolyspora mortivallis TaxID=33906 RepID=A0A2T0GYD5_ACTMO|nr:serpin family protein [Actinopolyspora mortivallis]PRW64114.1 serpin family protein [Actinopolyspora mortivallis]